MHGGQGVAQESVRGLPHGPELRGPAALHLADSSVVTDLWLVGVARGAPGQQSQPQPAATEHGPGNVKPQGHTATWQKLS